MYFHNRDKVVNAFVVFASSYALFRIYFGVLGARRPAFVRHVYFKGRRVHHYESGLYLAALGLALFLEDLHDWWKEEEWLTLE